MSAVPSDSSAAASPSRAVASTIADWPAAERPRERLVRFGPTGLSDAELLAVFLRTGTRRRDALAVARDALAACGGLRALLDAPPDAFCAIAGLGPARHAQLRAARELTRRSLVEAMAERPIFSSPSSVCDYLRLTIGTRPHEIFVALFLDAQHRLIAAEEMFRGTLAQTSVHPREVVKRALELNAAAVVLAHNHPSGVAEPSRADELLTATLAQALALVDVRVLDHFVVAGPLVYGFSEHGRM